MIVLVPLGLLSACSKDPGRPAPVPAAEAPAPVAAPEPASTDPVPAPAKALLPDTPEGFYASCRERVEGPSEAGECSSDADCVASGCSQEMCVSTATATAGDGLMSPCERAPCFQVLDRCTCQQGTCSWTLKADLPEPLRALVESAGAE